MKNKIDIVMQSLKNNYEAGLMAHLVTGYPTLSFSKKLARCFVKSGADIIEIQIPFSDPMADGPLIVEACQNSLDKGVTVNDSFILAKYIVSTLNTPVVLMTYANIPVCLGFKKFCNLCKEAGISAIIVPDLPYDTKEFKNLSIYSEKAKLHIIHVLSPSVERNRLLEITKYATGFIYCTSRQGTTGTGKKLSTNVGTYLKKIKKKCKIPIALGFGISSKKDFKLAVKHSNIGVVGSVIIETIMQNSRTQALQKVEKLITSFKNL